MGVLNFRGGITSASLGEGCFLCRSGSGLIGGWVAYTMGGEGGILLLETLLYYAVGATIESSIQWVRNMRN